MPHSATSCLVVAVVSLWLLACGQQGDAPEAPPAAPAAASTQQPGPGEAAHAAAGVRPGSHDDWCGEHQVPESLCTRCNASLIPAFQATGDWCAEHGLPESQCLLCNPGLQIRRPAPEGESTP